MTPRVAWLAIAVAIAGCALRRGDVPRWVEQPPGDDAYLYAVGTHTAAPTMEEARRGAVEQAVAELARRFGMTSQSFYNEIRTQLTTEVRDEIQSQSPKVEIKDALVQNWYIRRTPAGYDAFVLVRYPREQAEREAARLHSHEAAALHAAQQALRRGDAAREREDIAAAITAYLESASDTGGSAAAVALQTQATARLSSIAASLQIQAISGDTQRVRPLATADPLVVRAAMDGNPIAAVPLLFTVEGGQAEVTPARVNTGSDGTAAVTARVRASAGLLIVRASPDIERLRPRDIPADVPSGIDEALRAIVARTAEFRLLLDRTPRPLRVAVLIDERDGDVGTRRSVLSSLLSDRLHDAGFRVVAVQELGRSNVELLERSFDHEQFIALSPALSDLIDVAIGGWCETRPGSQNGGWATSVLADADVKAVELAHGGVIAAHAVIGRVGFGEHEGRARVEAMRAAAEELAEALVTQMAAYMDTANDQPLLNSENSDTD